MANDGRTQIATVFCHQLPPVVVKICGIQWQRLNIQWQRLEKTNFVNFLDGKSMEKNSENKPNSFNVIPCISPIILLESRNTYLNII